MEVGQHANAAAIYEHLAREALDHGFERQAPFLFIQAGRANLLAEQTQQGELLLREGIEWFIHQGRWHTLRRTIRRLKEDLNRMNQAALADEIVRWINAQPKQPGQPANLFLTANDPDPHKNERRRLPIKCPSCGAPVRPGEIEWLGETSAECAYCGGVMQVEP